VSNCEYDLTLDDEQREIRDAAHKFAAEVLRPAGIELDRMSPEAMVASGSPFYDVLQQAAELGYTRLAGPAELGAMQLPPVTHHMVWEELAWGTSVWPAPSRSRRRTYRWRWPAGARR